MGLAFMIAEGTRKPCSYDIHEPHQWPAWDNNPKGAGVSHLPWQWLTALNWPEDPPNKGEAMSGSGFLSANEVMGTGGDLQPLLY